MSIMKDKYKMGDGTLTIPNPDAKHSKEVFTVDIENITIEAVTKVSTSECGMYQRILSNESFVRGTLLGHVRTIQIEEEPYEKNWIIRMAMRFADFKKRFKGALD